MGTGPYLTAPTVTLLTPGGDLLLEGAIFWEDLLEGAVASNKDMIPRVTRVRWLAKDCWYSDDDDDNTKPPAIVQRAG